MADQVPAIPHEFEAAKTVFDALKPLPKAAQQRVLRWVAESLEVSLQALTTAVVAPTPPMMELPPAVPPNAPAALAADAQTMDILTFINAKQPQSDLQFVTAVGYYFRFVAPESQRRATINAEVVSEATRQANWDRFEAPHKPLNNAKAKGYLDSVGRGEFRINAVGENLVARSLPPESSENESSRTARRGGRKGGTKKGAAKKGAKKTAKKPTKK